MRPPGTMLRLSQRSTPARSLWVRCSSTAQTQSATSSEFTSSPPPSSDDKKSSLSRPSNWKTRRPYINPERPRQWNRPLAPGVLPAFDDAHLARVVLEFAGKGRRRRPSGEAAADDGDAREAVHGGGAARQFAATKSSCVGIAAAVWAMSAFTFRRRRLVSSTSRLSTRGS